MVCYRHGCCVLRGIACVIYVLETETCYCLVAAICSRKPKVGFQCCKSIDLWYTGACCLAIDETCRSHIRHGREGYNARSNAYLGSIEIDCRSVFLQSCFNVRSSDDTASVSDRDSGSILVTTVISRKGFSVQLVQFYSCSRQ